jgi:uncharacterized protein YoxC
MKKTELMQFLKEETRIILKESKYSSFLKKKSDTIDEVGKFHVIKKPTEGCLSEQIVFESDIFDLHEKLANGSLLREDIAAVVYKENRATKRCESLIREFDRNLKESWQKQIQGLQEKCDYITKSVTASKKFYKNKSLTEDVTQKHSRLEESVTKIQQNIKSINEKLRSYKKPIKETPKGRGGKTNIKTTNSKKDDSKKVK